MPAVHGLTSFIEVLFWLNGNEIFVLCAYYAVHVFMLFVKNTMSYFLRDGVVRDNAEDK